LPHEFFDQVFAREAGFNVASLAYLVDEVCAGREGEFLGEDEGVVAVE
jgi:hypothetical protein